MPLVSLSATDTFDRLQTIYATDRLALREKYQQWLDELKALAGTLTRDEQTRFSDFYTRLSHLCERENLARQEARYLHHFRARAGAVSGRKYQPNPAETEQDFKALVWGISALLGVPVPPELKASLAAVSLPAPPPRPKGQRVPRLRVRLREVQLSSLDVVLLADREDEHGDSLIRICLGEVNGNAPLAVATGQFWPGACLNLIDVLVTDAGEYHPRFVVLEPDYLLDVSALAECYKPYGNSPLNFLHSRLEARENTAAILLGNLANFFLDEVLNEHDDQPLVFNDLLKRGFQQQPFEFTNCAELQQQEGSSKFKEDALRVYQNIRDTIEGNPFKVNKLERDQMVVEPSFYSDDYGVQGRFDLFQPEKEGTFQIVELKSGKAPYPEWNLDAIGENHQVQKSLYNLMVQGVYDIFPFGDKKIKAHIFYAKAGQGHLRSSIPFLNKLQEMLNKRNEIVAQEHRISSDGTGAVALDVLTRLQARHLILREMHPNFLAKVQPKLDTFHQTFAAATRLEKTYVGAFLSFIATELFVAKTGDGSERSRGGASLWRSSHEEKLSTGEILHDLFLIENCCDDALKSLTFGVPVYENEYLPNFRKGDVCVLHAERPAGYDVLRGQVFKCTIESVSATEVKVRLRFQQRKKEVFDPGKRWALEPDILDSAIAGMYRNLYAFLEAAPVRRRQLLGLEPPRVVEPTPFHNPKLNEGQNRLVAQALAAPDYFLVIGPPGTGKTKVMLRNLVGELFRAGKSILLLAYTNRAVDEICEAVDEAIPAGQGEDATCKFIRIGQELTCDERFRHCLLDVVAGQAKNRADLRERLNRHPVFVGTVASLVARPELFSFREFDVAIVDEASQILEPQLVGLLPQVKKFILIGDQKQLPAIVVQSDAQAAVPDSLPELHAIGLKTRKNSLFERLIERCKSQGWTHAYGLLDTQGRMHEEIAWFPNHVFYGGKLHTLPDSITPKDDSRFAPLKRKSNPTDPLQRLLATRRMVFIPSERNESEPAVSAKTHPSEAKAAARLAKTIVELYARNGQKFDPARCLGIITPYRRQIALIRKCLREEGLSEEITVDTVERYQGSQRDVIIYSFAVSSSRQIELLQNNYFDPDPETGFRVDRKLNVAITRARQQLIFLGDEGILGTDLLYFRLFEYIKTQGGYVPEGVAGLLENRLPVAGEPDESSLAGKVYEPDPAFAAAFERVVLQPIRSRSLNFPADALGFSPAVCRDQLIQYGRADFEQALLVADVQGKLRAVSPTERVLAYAYFNQRKHYFSAYAIFEQYRALFVPVAPPAQQRIVFIDIGCGPLTSGLAFRQSLSRENPAFQFRYVGIDVSPAMLNLANEFAGSALFGNQSSRLLLPSLDRLPFAQLDDWFATPHTVVFNGSYLFANLTPRQADDLAERLNALLDRYPLNRYLYVHQNPAAEARNRSYFVFKKALSPRFRRRASGTETVRYRNQEQSFYDKSETVFYEILST